VFWMRGVRRSENQRPPRVRDMMISKGGGLTRSRLTAAMPLLQPDSAVQCSGVEMMASRQSSADRGKSDITR
jgi:hypothetical protein